MISLVGLNKAKVLAALYNRSTPLGMGFLHYEPAPMGGEEAQQLLDASNRKYFDYIKGRVMKSDLSKDEFDPSLFDRDNGQGAAESAINEVRKGLVDSPELREAHNASKLAAAFTAEVRMQEGIEVSGNVVSMGLADVASVLGPAVQKALENK